MYGAQRANLPTQIGGTESAKKLQSVVNNSHQVLFKATTVFPLTLFPDTIIIDREKLTIKKKSFFKVSEIMSIHLKDILNVTANIGPVFGSIKIDTRFFGTNRPYKVDFFWRGDALKIKRIMQGYIIAIQKKIDCSNVAKDRLLIMLEELGKGV